MFLDIVEQFVCLQCGECCNQEWLVTVDEQGYHRNERLFAEIGKTGEFRQAFHLLQKDADYGEHARIAKKATGGCWFLSENNLCRLQQLSGHEHLDKVCQWFPRYPMDTERGIEMSLSFSCPAALQLALRKEPLRVVRRAESPVDMICEDYVSHVYPSQQPMGSPLRHYFELEGHLIDLLQTRKLPLTQRLAIVRRSMLFLLNNQESAHPPENIDRMIKENYMQIDAVETDEMTREDGPGDCLMENFFVNFIFRKNIYTNGLVESVYLLNTMENQLTKYLSRPQRDQIDNTELMRSIVGLELAINHKSKKI